MDPNRPGLTLTKCISWLRLLRHLVLRYFAVVATLFRNIVRQLLKYGIGALL
jgi:hypothetical protein